MDEREAANTRDEESKRTSSMFLSVYLLLLAFFILLNSISTFHEVRTKAVMDSLTSTFATLMPVRSVPYSSQTGTVVGARDLFDRVGELFEAAIPAAKIKVAQTGHLMQVSFPVDALFLPDKPDIRPAQGALVNRLAAALGAPPRGVRYEATLLVGIGQGETAGLPIGENLAVARTGAFAREMVRRGAAPEVVVVGLEPGDPTMARALFRVIIEEDAGAAVDADE